MSAYATLAKSDVDFEHTRIIHQTRDTKEKTSIRSFGQNIFGGWLFLLLGKNHGN